MVKNKPVDTRIKLEIEIEDSTFGKFSFSLRQTICN